MWDTSPSLSRFTAGLALHSTQLFGVTLMAQCSRHTLLLYLLICPVKPSIPLSDRAGLVSSLWTTGYIHGNSDSSSPHTVS